jgi:hypothetical protein
MDTTQLVRASAEVVTITSLKAGDVYKRIETLYTGEANLRFGVVQSVMNNGTESAFTALEVRPDFVGVAVESKVYDGSKPIALFAATPDEVGVVVSEAREAIARKVAAAEKALTEARNEADRIGDLIDRVNHSALTAPTVAGEIAS